jgi:DNA-binding NarL/FixJ family response regulator
MEDSMRVLIVDDHALVRRALRGLLEERGHQVVGEAENGREGVGLARLYQPDVVLMDLTMPVMDGLTATRLISAELPEVKVVVLTASEDDEDLLEAVKSGASGYVPKNMDSDQFFALLEGVLHGERTFTPALAPKVLGEFKRAAGDGNSLEPLTEREREVLEMMAQGVTSDRELAERLFVSPNTVKYHLSNILKKLHMRNRAQVVAYAFRYGLVGEPDRHSS